MTINIENNVFAEIGSGLTSGTLLLNIKGGKETLFPPAPFTLNVVKFNSTGTVLLREIVNVTSKAGNIFIITRAYEPVPVNDAALTTSQVAYDFDEGDMVYMTLTAGMLETIDTDIQSRIQKAGGQFSGRVDFAKGANIASASTVNLATATGNMVHITGTTTITALGTLQAGTEMCLIFDGILTLTHNATSLKLPTSANIATQAGDRAYFRSEGSGNWICTSYQRADGTALYSGIGYSLGVKLASQTLNSGVVVGDPVFFSNGKWHKSTSTTQFPTGIVSGANEVQLSGKYVTTGLVAGETYYMGISGGVTTEKSSDFVVFVAISTTEAELKIFSMTNSRFFQGIGYVLGGYTTTASTEVQGMIFATETATNPSGTIGTARDTPAGVSSATTGYAGGGQSALTSISGWDFATESGKAISANLASGRSGMGGVSSGVKGYFLGGYNGSSRLSEIDGIQFSDDTAINPAATLSAARGDLQSSVNSGTRGYAMGGTTTAPASTSEIDGIQFSDDTAINPAATLSGAITSSVGVSSSTRGYTLGGASTYGGAATSEIYGFIFSTETATNPAATLAVAVTSATGVSSATTGYSMGAVTPSTEIQGMIFSTETATNPAATLAVAVRLGAGVQSFTS